MRKNIGKVITLITDIPDVNDIDATGRNLGRGNSPYDVTIQYQSGAQDYGFVYRYLGDEVREHGSSYRNRGWNHGL